MPLPAFRRVLAHLGVRPVTNISLYFELGKIDGFPRMGPLPISSPPGISERGLKAPFYAGPRKPGQTTITIARAVAQCFGVGFYLEGL